MTQKVNKNFAFSINLFKRIKQVYYEIEKNGNVLTSKCNFGINANEAFGCFQRGKSIYRFMKYV